MLKRVKLRRLSFHLLEVTVALALISMCSYFLFRVPVNLLQTDIALLEAMQLEAEAENRLATIKAALYEERIPWEIVSNRKEKKGGLYEERTITLSPTEKTVRKYKEKVHLMVYKTDDETQKVDDFLVHILLTYSPIHLRKDVAKERSFLYKVHVGKRAVENNSL